MIKSPRDIFHIWLSQKVGYPIWPGIPFDPYFPYTQLGFPLQLKGLIQSAIGLLLSVHTTITSCHVTCLRGVYTVLPEPIPHVTWLRMLDLWPAWIPLPCIQFEKAWHHQIGINQIYTMMPVPKKSVICPKRPTTLIIIFAFKFYKMQI